MPASPSATTTTLPVEPTSGEGGISPWLWWLLGLLVVVGGGTGLFLARRRSAERDQWRAGVAGSVREAQWLSHDVLAALDREQEPAGRGALWHIARPRVEELETGLSSLVSATPGQDVLARPVTLLASAVRRARITVDQILGSGAGAEAAQTAFLNARIELDEAIAAVHAAQEPAAGGAPGSPGPGSGPGAAPGGGGRHS